jgi:hypothetical protein
MRNLLQRFGSAYITELRLLCKHWGYALLHLLWVGLLIYTGWNRDIGSARFAMNDSFGEVSVAFVSLVSLFIAGISASRGRRLRFAALDDTLPTGAEVVLGRWAAALTAAAALLSVPLLLMLRQGPFASFFAEAPRFLGEALLVLAFSTIAAWWLIHLLGRRSRWSYLLLAGVWVGSSVGLELRDTYEVGLPQLTLLQFARDEHLRYADLWGRLRSENLSLWFNLCYLGLTLALLALIVLRVQYTRFRRRGVGAGAALLGAVALAAFGGVQYTTTLHAMNARIAEDAWIHGPPETSRPIDPERDTPESLYGLPDQAEQITRYDIIADLSNPAQPHFSAKLDLYNAGSEPITRFALTLSHDFAITRADLPHTREGDRITLQLPQPLAPRQTLSMTLEYGGALWCGWRVFNDMPQSMFFTDAQGVRLSTAIGWYPLAGSIKLSVGDSTIFHSYHLPVDMRLEVQTDASFPTISNLPQVSANVFEGRQTIWAMLFASPELASAQVGDVRLVAARDNLAALQPFAEQYDRVLAVHQRFIPDVPFDGLTLMVLDENDGLPSETPPTPGHPIVISSRNQLFFTREALAASYDPGPFFVGRAVTGDFWQLGNGDTDNLTFGAASEFLWSVARAQGDAGKVGVVNAQRNIAAQPLVEQLGDVYRQHGEEAVVRALRRLRDIHGDRGMDLAYLEQVIDEAAVAD